MNRQEIEDIGGKTRLYVIGIDDNPHPGHIEAVIGHIPHDSIFSGGKRHYEIVKPLLPAGSEWIEVKVPIKAVLAEYEQRVEEGKTIVVFASGDPFFFGFGSTLRKNLPQVKMEVFPFFSSLQAFAHRKQIAYENMHAVSVTGRPWHELDRAWIECRPLIGVLTDHVHTPDAIARRMQEYGFDKDYTMWIAEHLGNPEEERIYDGCTIEDIAGMSFKSPNCILLLRNPESREQRLASGIPDHLFQLLDGRINMITKAPLRVIDLSLLNLHESRSFWDVGACTGSISVEARRQYPHLYIRAFEVRKECEEIIQENARRFHAPGIELRIGDFLDADIGEETSVDAVFIGGHGGKLKEMVRKIVPHLDASKGRIVFNSVTDESGRMFREAAEENGLALCPEMHITLDRHNPITLFCATTKHHQS